MKKIGYLFAILLVITLLIVCIRIDNSCSLCRGSLPNLETGESPYLITDTQGKQQKVCKACYDANPDNQVYVMYVCEGETVGIGEINGPMMPYTESDSIDLRCYYVENIELD